MTGIATGLVVQIDWTDGSIPRSETYGPWPLDPGETWLFDPADDHTKSVPAFVRDWMAMTECEPQRIVLTLVQDPGPALDAIQAEKEAR